MDPKGEPCGSKQVQNMRGRAREAGPVRAAPLAGRQVASTKAVGTAAEDYDEIVAPSGRHSFREEVASNLSKSGLSL